MEGADAATTEKSQSPTRRTHARMHVCGSAHRLPGSHAGGLVETIERHDRWELYPPSLPAPGSPEIAALRSALDVAQTIGERLEREEARLHEVLERTGYSDRTVPGSCLDEDCSRLATALPLPPRPQRTGLSDQDWQAARESYNAAQRTLSRATDALASLARIEQTRCEITRVLADMWRDPQGLQRACWASRIHSRRWPSTRTKPIEDRPVAGPPSHGNGTRLTMKKTSRSTAASTGSAYRRRSGTIRARPTRS